MEVQPVVSLPNGMPFLFVRGHGLRRFPEGTNVSSRG
jgi:hypothetical protein